MAKPLSEFIGRYSDKPIILPTDQHNDPGPYLGDPKHYNQPIAAVENVKNIINKYKTADWSDPAIYLDLLGKAAYAFGTGDQIVKLPPIDKDSYLGVMTESDRVGILNSANMVNKWLRSNSEIFNKTISTALEAKKILKRASKLTSSELVKETLEGNPANDINTKEYTDIREPYGEVHITDGSSISDIKKNLEAEKLLVGYKDFQGFELGSNHLWRMDIKPYYPSWHPWETCTPDLPYYELPSIWVGKNDGSVMTPFSYSINTPVLTYDLNFGTIKTEGQPLFNGSTMEVFMGMQFNATLNLSILDDVYNSMHKYMTSYINSIYDINTHSLAPFYNMAFEIDLIIFRAGMGINHRYKFIGVPVEYTPRLEGQSEAQECRIDMTFGIIGLIAPPNRNSGVYGGSRLSTNKSNQSRLTWNDVMINMGNTKS